MTREGAVCTGMKATRGQMSMEHLRCLQAARLRPCSLLSPLFIPPYALLVSMEGGLFGFSFIPGLRSQSLIACD